MAKNRTYDTTRGNVSEGYAQRVRIDPSATSLSLDVIADDCEKIMQKESDDEEIPSQFFMSSAFYDKRITRRI